MAKVIFTGVIVKESVKQNNETTFFRVSENTGSKDSPQYNYFDCSGRFSEKQREYIRPGMVVEIVGALNIVKREHHIIFKIVTVTKTQIESESLEVRKKSLASIFEQHFLMSKKQIEELLSYLSSENYTYVLNNIHRISDYIKAHEVGSVSDYAYTSILNIFKNEVI